MPLAFASASAIDQLCAALSTSGSTISMHAPPPTLPLTVAFSVTVSATPGVFRLITHDTFVSTPAAVALVVSMPASIARPLAPSNVDTLALAAAVAEGGATVSFTTSVTSSSSGMSPAVVVTSSVLVPLVHTAVAITSLGVENSITGVDGILQPCVAGSTTLICPPSNMVPTLVKDTVLSVVIAAVVSAAVHVRSPPSAPIDMLAIATLVVASTT